MLRYKTETRCGLVALYDIRPGNGAGPFLQPRSRHGAELKVLHSSDGGSQRIFCHSSHKTQTNVVYHNVRRSSQVMSLYFYI